MLPGLLLSFACRLDWSKKLVSLSEGHADEESGGAVAAKLNSTRARANSIVHGYYVYMCLGYGIGLMMANIAVYAMQMGQPALLYLVPMTLGWMIYLAVRRREMNEIWHGPNVMKQAREVLYAWEEGGAVGGGGLGGGGGVGGGGQRLGRGGRRQGASWERGISMVDGYS